MENLTKYFQLAHDKVTVSQKSENRKKVFIVNPKYSHFDEVDERL